MVMRTLCAESVWTTKNKSSTQPNWQKYRYVR